MIKLVRRDLRPGTVILSRLNDYIWLVLSNVPSHAVDTFDTTYMRFRRGSAPEFVKFYGAGQDMAFNQDQVIYCPK